MPTRARSGSWRQSHGAVLFATVVALSLAIIVIFAGTIFGISEMRAGRTERTLDGLKRIEDALIQFVAVNGRLPCPANGTLDTGVENPADPNPQNGAATCATLVGTVPWLTLGISQDFALDAWAQKISYRVFHGATGLTQTGGASMSDCDLYDTGLSIPLPANGLCETVTHDNTAEQFLSGKGLSFDDKGDTTSGVAFVLISHGPTGRGAFLPGGVQTPLPNAANVPERANAANDTLIPAQRTFYARGFSDPSASPDDANHFDDLTRFIRIDELIRKAARGPRDWPDPGEVGFDETTTADMTTAGTGHFLATGDALQGQVFVRGSSPDIVTLGSGSTSQFSACLWWPSPLTLYIPPPPTDPSAPPTIKSFRMAVDFSFPDVSVTTAAGLVVGFISGKTPPDINTCGTNSSNPADAEVVLGNLGWGGGNYTPPNNRFGVEIDINAQTAAPYTDPANNHVAIDTFNTYHAGTVGPVCPGPNCTTAWLRDGTTNYHRLRIELEPISAFCGGEITFSPQLRTWIMPHDVCTANPVACIAMRLQDPYPIIEDPDPTIGFPPGTVYTQTCLPSPSENDAYHSIYFGFTSAKAAGPGYPVLNLKQLQSGVY